jgi:hypothetical protein
MKYGQIGVVEYCVVMISVYIVLSAYIQLC